MDSGSPCVASGESQQFIYLEWSCCRGTGLFSICTRVAYPNASCISSQDRSLAIVALLIYNRVLTSRTRILTIGRARGLRLHFLLWPLMVLSFPSLLLSSELSPAVQSEIQHLLTHIEQSGCEFYRNGIRYRDTKAVRDHVELKYGYFMKKGQITSTEDFIKWSASKSEMSGKPYMVNCGNGSSLLLAQWLSDELDRYRRESR